MKQIKFGIPEKEDFIRWASIAKFKLIGGFKCSGCGTKQNFHNGHFESWVHDKKFMCENHNYDGTTTCPDCIRKEINEKADIVFTEKDCKCDWCSEHKNTMSFPRHADLKSKITFGCSWWNGHHICQDCFNIGIDEHDELRSSHLKLEDGKTYHCNEIGMWIKVK